MPVTVCGPKDKVPEGVLVVNTTSSSKTWGKMLSPFFLGPVKTYCSVSQNMENAWQYSKVYECHAYNANNTCRGEPDFLPNNLYYAWRDAGWRKKWADSYPMGKGAKPLFSWWKDTRLDYIEARKQIYAPLYAEVVQKTEAWKHLKEMYVQGKDIWLWDYDGYNSKALGNMSYKDVIECKYKKMGHAFVLAMLLENQQAWI